MKFYKKDHELHEINFPVRLEGIKSEQTPQIPPISVKIKT